MPGRVIQGFFIGGGMRQRGAAPRRPEMRAPGGASRQGAPVRPGPPPLLGDRGPAATQAAPIQPFRPHANITLDPGEIRLERGGGNPLPRTILAKMEAAFGADFSAVRVHVGPQPARIGALAFTTGNDIYFANGQFQPDTVRGQQLIGHELAHVIQQRQGRVRGAAQGVTVVQDRMLEAEAERMGWQAIRHAGAIQRAIGHPAGARAAPVVVQRMKRRAGAMTAVAVPAAGPALAPAPRRFVRARRAQEPRLGTNGYFTQTRGPVGGMRYVARFTLHIPGGVEDDGFILQAITRTFQVERPNAAGNMAATAINTYVELNPGSAAHAGETTYWEVWSVANGVIGHYGDDEFTICSFVDATIAPHLDTTKGSYRISGSATYYACGAVARDAFIAGLANPAQCAGVLGSTLDNPTAGLPACTTSNTLVRTVTSTWDSTDNGAGAVTQDTTVTTA